MSALFCVGQSSVAQPALFTSWHSSKLVSASEQPASPAAVRMLVQKVSQLEVDADAEHILQTLWQTADAFTVAPLPEELPLDGAVDGTLDDLPAADASPVPPSGSS